MFLAKQLPAFSAVNTPICGIEPFPAGRLQTRIIEPARLPVLLCDDILRVKRFGLIRYDGLRGTGRSTCARESLLVLVRLEYVQALEFLIQYG
jgi:hypothetical protein